MEKPSSKPKTERIFIQINFFGPYIAEKDISDILDFKKTERLFDFQRHLLELFFDLPRSILSKEILKRYTEITTADLHLSITPHTSAIHKRLLQPLRSAKKNYCLGEYSSTIASCGIVGEMLAILVWKMNETKIRTKLLTEDDERGLFGSSFEKLSQDRRLKILKTFKQISKIQYDSFVAIKNSRRSYLHLWATDLKDEKKDALNVLEKSFELFKKITGIGLADGGTIKVNPLLLKFLKKEQKKK